MRPIVARLTGLLHAGAALTAIFSIATVFDDLHRYLELFSHFRVQYLAVAALLAVLFAALRNRRYLAMMLAVTALNAWYVAPWYQSTGAAVDSDTQFKVLLANVLTSNGDHDRLASLLAAERPDFVFLLEVSSGWAKELDSINGYAYRHVVPREGAFGIAMLSRVPIDSGMTILSPPYEHPTIVAMVSLDDRSVTFTTTHPMPPIGDANYAARNEQLRHIAEIVNRQSGARVLVGDLNTTMWGANYRKLIETTGLANTRQGFGILPTWPTNIPVAFIPIDHCLISEELAVLDLRTGPNIGSDHLPLIITLSLDQAASAALGS